MRAYIQSKPKAVRYALLVLVAIVVPGGIALAAAIHYSTKGAHHG